MTVVAAILIGLAGGVVSGLLGVGGGILFVPALALVLGLDQIEAIASSLVAIIPVALVGTTRQHRYGNVRLKEGAVVGLLSIPGVVLGTVAANAVSNRALEVAFGCLLIAIAAQLVRRALKASAIGGE